MSKWRKGGRDSLSTFFRSIDNVAFKDDEGEESIQKLRDMLIVLIDIYQ